MIIIVMGVSGSGKSSVGHALAARTGWQFIEGDDLHPAANRNKMASGQPLTDDDRWPWLDAIAASARAIDTAGGSAVIACSALKRIYRDRLAQAGDNVEFVHLSGDHETILARMQARPDHFMPAGLLDSQFAALEPPSNNENAYVFNVTLPVDDIAQQIADAIYDSDHRTG
jgi:gluconokinase